MYTVLCVNAQLWYKIIVMDITTIFTSEVFMVGIGTVVGTVLGHLTSSRKQSNDFQRSFFVDQQSFRKEVLEDLARHKIENEALIEDIGKLRAELRLQHEENLKLKSDIASFRVDLQNLQDNYNHLLNEKQELLSKLRDQKTK